MRGAPLEGGTQQQKDSRPFGRLVAEPIFVVGAARSGTTWVYDILTAHPLVAGAFETWLFTPADGLKSLFSEAHWPPRRSGLGGVLARAELLSYTRDMAERVLSHYIGSTQIYLVEKSPSHLFAIPFIHELFPDARFIHVLRDGRDVAASVKAAAESWAPAWRKSFGKSIKASARAWRHAVKFALRQGDVLGGQFMEIRYEELSRDPFNAYRRLFEFCRIPYDEAVLQTIYARTDFQSNYRPSRKAFRRKGIIGDWRTEFNLLDAVMFHAEAGEKLRLLGYEKNSLWVLSRLPGMGGASRVKPGNR